MKGFVFNAIARGMARVVWSPRNAFWSPCMKPHLVAAALAAIALGAALPARAADVGVSIQISEPGVFGRIDIGRFPQPQVIVQRPIVIHRPVAVAPPPPVYLWVPPGHRQNWRRHCGQYNACGVPVYFVRHDWYERHVHHRGPRDEAWRGDRRDDHRGRGQDHRRDDRRDERGDRRGGGPH